MNRGQVECRRIIAGLIYVSFAVILSIWLIYNVQVYYLIGNEMGFENWPRYAYVLIFFLVGTGLGLIRIGFDGKAEKLRHTPVQFSLDHVIKLPLFSAALSALIFALFSIHQATDNYLFYYFTSAVALILGYRFDNSIAIIDRSISKLENLATGNKS